MATTLGPFMALPPPILRANRAVVRREAHAGWEWSSVDVAVGDGGIEPVVAQLTRQLLGEHDRSVPSPGAAHGDAEVALALVDEGGQQQAEEPVEPFEEF